jgi:predicted Zn-dependent protease
MKQAQPFLQKFIKNHQSQVDFLGVRYCREKNSRTSVRNETLESSHIGIDEGVMIEVMIQGHLGYSATCDLTEGGLKKAFSQAAQQTERAARYRNFTFTPEVRPKASGQFISPRKKSLAELSPADTATILIKASQELKTSARVVSRKTSSALIETQTFYATSQGTEIEQDYQIVMVDASATAQKDSEFQTRSLNGWNSRTFQIGAEAFDGKGLFEDCRRVGEQAEELVFADNCPSDTMELLVAPDQMMIQIHESIGHPLELDRILGDERNFAGWSFVKLEDIGTLQYGSKIMNVTFDPTMSGEVASYGFDDSGLKATQQYLIKDGILQRVLGGVESQIRSGKPGVANFRASGWNRAPIDRMANINLEPGSDSVEEMISSVKKGLLVQSNKSWSIDDYRNKFQFGCEYAQLIEDGRITRTVRNSNYRGTTLNFWRQLEKVGRQAEPFAAFMCGKGEPSQTIRVGHSSPYCLFKGVEVFGG